jgi:hypothetical protein
MITVQDRGWNWSSLLSFGYFPSNQSNWISYTEKRHGIFSLSLFEQISPSELFQRKIEVKDYHQALSIAEKFQLDTDLLYQKQWSLSVVSSQGINVCSKSFIN